MFPYPTLTLINCIKKIQNWGLEVSKEKVISPVTTIGVDCSRLLGRAHDSLGMLSIGFPNILPRGFARKPFNATTLFKTHAVQREICIKRNVVNVCVPTFRNDASVVRPPSAVC